MSMDHSYDIIRVGILKKQVIYIHTYIYTVSLYIHSYLHTFFKKQGRSSSSLPNFGAGSATFNWYSCHLFIMYECMYEYMYVYAHK